MMTINAAWQIHEDDDKGSIAPGKHADFVLIDANPLTGDPTEIAGIKVLATVKDGALIHGSLDCSSVSRRINLLVRQGKRPSQQCHCQHLIRWLRHCE